MYSTVIVNVESTCIIKTYRQRHGVFCAFVYCTLVVYIFDLDRTGDYFITNSNGGQWWSTECFVHVSHVQHTFTEGPQSDAVEQGSPTWCQGSPGSPHGLSKVPAGSVLKWNWSTRGSEIVLLFESVPLTSGSTTVCPRTDHHYFVQEVCIKPLALCTSKESLSFRESGHLKQNPGTFQLLVQRSREVSPFSYYLSKGQEKLWGFENRG